MGHELVSPCSTISPPKWLPEGPFGMALPLPFTSAVTSICLWYMCWTVRHLLPTVSWLELTAEAAAAAALPRRAFRSSYAFRISFAALHAAKHVLARHMCNDTGFSDQQAEHTEVYRVTSGV